MTCQSAPREAKKEIATERIADQCANARPSFQPRNPASIAPTSGENAAIQESAIKSIVVLSPPRRRGPDYPFRLQRSSTLMDLRFLNNATRIARPMADSAAAT